MKAGSQLLILSINFFLAIFFSIFAVASNNESIDKLNITVRVVVLLTYIYVICAVRIIQKNNAHKMVNGVTFKDDKSGQEWLDYVLYFSIKLFVPLVLVSVVLHIIGVTAFVDLVLSIVAFFVWVVIIYTNTDEYSIWTFTENGENNY